jgi:hypothetical protein
VEVLQVAARLVAFDRDDAALAPRGFGERLEVGVGVGAEAGEKDGGGRGVVERADDRGGKIVGDGEGSDAGGGGSGSDAGGSGSGSDAGGSGSRSGRVCFRFAARGEEGEQEESEEEQGLASDRSRGGGRPVRESAPAWVLVRVQLGEDPILEVHPAMGSALSHIDGDQGSPVVRREGDKQVLVGIYVGSVTQSLTDWVASTQFLDGDESMFGYGDFLRTGIASVK